MEQAVELKVSKYSERSGVPYYADDVDDPLTATDLFIATYLSQLRVLGELVVERTTVAESPDPEDNRIVAAAIDGKAEYLVSYNTEHFRDVSAVPILHPSDFQKQIEAF